MRFTNTLAEEQKRTTQKEQSINEQELHVEQRDGFGEIE